MDSIFTGADTVATLAGGGAHVHEHAEAGGTLTLSSGAGAVSPFAARFYKVNVAAAVDTLRVDFTAGAGFTRPVVQSPAGRAGQRRTRHPALGSHHVVADYRQRPRRDLARPHPRDCRWGGHGGSYTLTAQTVAAAPDVMVTRWHHRAGKHHESTRSAGRGRGCRQISWSTTTSTVSQMARCSSTRTTSCTSACQQGAPGRRRHRRAVLVSGRIRRAGHSLAAGVEHRRRDAEAERPCICAGAPASSRLTGHRRPPALVSTSAFVP